MRRILLAILCLLGPPALAAQVIAPGLPGIWQGTIQNGNSRRIILKITQTPTANYKAILYYADLGGIPHPASSATLDGQTAKIALPSIGTSIEATLSPDGATLTGTWMQATRTSPLLLTRTTPGTEWPIPEQPAQLPPMDPAANPSVEVATVKPSGPDAQGGYFIDGRRFRAGKTTLTELLSFAYGLQTQQMSGLPAWASTELYDIDAESDGEGAPSLKQWKAIFRVLLTDRFKIASHDQKRELPVYLLSVAKTGPKLTPNETEGIPLLDLRRQGNLHVRDASIAEIAHELESDIVDRPVLDRTSLPGRFDFILRWHPDALKAPGDTPKPRRPDHPTTTDPTPDLFTAIQEQLGLKLTPSRASVDVLVIDHAERPGPN